MKGNFSKRVALGMALLLVAAIPTASVADDSIVEIHRDEVGEKVLAYSPTVKGLDLDAVQLSQQYLDLKEQMEDLEDLYDQLGTYESLYNLYNSLSSDYYTTYMGLILSGDETKIAEAAGMIDGDEAGEGEEPGSDTDGNGLDDAAEKELATDVASMPVESYGAFIALESVFSAMGISNPNLSRQEEYDTFIYPTKVAPAAYRKAARLMSVAVEQAAAGVKTGAESLYDAVLLMEGYQEMQDLNYIVKADALETAKKKYELGQLSEIAYKQAVNEEAIARLSAQTMARDVENIRMQLNVMLGNDVETRLVLGDVEGDTIPLESLDYYIQRGQEQRAEIRNDSYNRNYEETVLDVAEEYLGDDSIDYKRADYGIKDLDLALSYSMKEIEAQVRKAYMEVLDKEESLRVSKLSLEDALRQQQDLELNIALGYVTGSTAESMKLLVAQATNEYNKIYREYLEAYASLELVSTIGATSADS